MAYRRDKARHIGANFRINDVLDNFFAMEKIHFVDTALALLRCLGRIQSLSGNASERVFGRILNLGSEISGNTRFDFVLAHANVLLVTSLI